MLIAVVEALAADSAAWASSPSESSDHPKRRSTVPKKEADLSISKSASANGNTFVFTITVHNDGPSVAEDVRVTDNLSNHFTVISVSGPKCSGRQNVTCKLDQLGVDKSATITIGVRVKDNFKGEITNTASVSSKTKDPNPNNNSASATVVVAAQPTTDLAISQKVKEAGGDSFIFNVTVSNTGSVAAEKVVVTDQLSDRFELVSAKGAQCSRKQNITCSLGTLGVGKSITLDIRVEVESKNDRGSISHTVNVGSTTTDSNSANNSSTVTVTAKGRR
jgi:uncharacterized repeat protein (TIGR01451 family)